MLVADLQSTVPLSLGLVVLLAAISGGLLLAFAVLRSNYHSATSRTFFFLSFFTLLWLISSHVFRLQDSPEGTLLFARISIALAAPMSAMIFLVAHTLPSPTLRLQRFYFWTTLAVVGIMAGFNLTPFAFTGVEVRGDSIGLVAGPGIIPFSIISTFFSVAALYILAARMRRAEGVLRAQLRMVLSGLGIMLALIVFTVLVPILVFDSVQFVPFTPLYVLVFLAMTAYAIVKHHLFNVKVIATEALTIIIWILLFSKILSNATNVGIVVDSLIFIATVALGIVLIKSVRREVAQREKLETLARELEKANDQLESLNRFKTQLISLASHQMKAPLAAIKGFASILLEGLYGPMSDKVKETVQKMKDSANGLIDLINNLLDMRRVEEGKMEYLFARVSLDQMITGVVEELRPLARKKGLELGFSSKASSEIFVKADPKLKQVIQNIVDNSLKYTLQGFVRVGLREEGADAIISIADSGLGMSKELIPHLFKEFVREESIKKQIRGTGLGLYIADKIIQAHGGSIWAESAGEGKGSQFYIKLKKV